MRMRLAKVLFREEEAGTLTQHSDGTFTFRYNDHWLRDHGKPDISLTLPKRQQEYTSSSLFPFFYNLLPEGANKQVICRLKRIDERDDFGLLMATAPHDCIGAIGVIAL